MNQTAKFLGLQHGSLITFTNQNVQGLAEPSPRAEQSAWGKTQAASSGYQKDRLGGPPWDSAVAVASAVRAEQTIAMVKGRFGFFLGSHVPL